MQHTMKDPPRLREQVAGLPHEVEEVLFKALAKDPKERFASVQAMALALQQASALTAPSLPTPHTPGEQPPAVSLTKTLPPSTPPSRKIIVTTPMRKPSLSKALRALLVVLTLLLLGSGGSYVWSVNTSHLAATATAITHSEGTARAKLASTATGNAAISAYNTYITQHGIMFGFDARHARNNPYESILNADNVSRLHQTWAAPTGNSIYSSPVVANGLIYIGSYHHTLYAFDAATGEQKWHSSPTENVTSSSPAVTNGLVYVGSWDHKLYAFDATSGQQRWVASTGDAILSSPVVANGLVYIGSGDYKLYAFDAATGKQKWVSFHAGSLMVDSLNDSSPAVANGLVYVGSGDYKLHAFDAATGKQKWATSTGAGISSSPIVANGLVYIGSHDHKLYTFDAATGKQKWVSPPTGNIITCSPAIANGIIYVGSGDGKLYASSLP